MQLTPQQELFMQAIKDLGGKGTSEEISDRAGKDLHREAASLVKADEIEASAERRKTRSGSTATVWQLPDPNYKTPVEEFLS